MKIKLSFRILLKVFLVMCTLSACTLNGAKDQDDFEQAIVEVKTEEIEEVKEVKAEEVKDEGPKENEIIIDDMIPEEAVQTTLRHFAAIEEGDMTTLLSTLGIDDENSPSLNIASRHYSSWLASELIERFAGTGLCVKEIDGSDGDVLYVTAYITNNVNDNIDEFSFAMSGDDTLPWYINFYINMLDNFTYQEETLSFVNYEGILVDSRITATEVELINAIKRFFNALESGDVEDLHEQMVSSDAEELSHWIENYKGSGISIKEIELMNNNDLHWCDTAKITVSHKAYGLDTSFTIDFEPFERLAGEQVWRIFGSDYIDVQVNAGGLWQSANFDTYSIYDWMALDFMLNHYPAYFLDHFVKRGVSDFYHDGLDVPIPKGMNHFASANEMGEPDSFEMYKLSDGSGKPDVIIILVNFSSFWYGGERAYGFYNGSFALMDEFDLAGIDFWRSQNFGTFMSLRTNDYYNFHTMNFNNLREDNEFWGRTIREQVRRDIVNDEEPGWDALSRHVGFDYLEKLEPIVQGWHDQEQGVFTDFVRNYASGKSIEHITNPADRLMLALLGSHIGIWEADYIAVVVPEDEADEWILIVDDKRYVVTPDNPQLLDFIGEDLAYNDGDIFKMDLENKSNVPVREVVEFIQNLRVD